MPRRAKKAKETCKKAENLDVNKLIKESKGKSSGEEPFTKDIYVYLEGGLEMIEKLK